MCALFALELDEEYIIIKTKTVLPASCDRYFG